MIYDNMHLVAAIAQQVADNGPLPLVIRTQEGNKVVNLVEHTEVEGFGPCTQLTAVDPE